MTVLPCHICLTFILFPPVFKLLFRTCTPSEIILQVLPYFKFFFILLFKLSMNRTRRIVGDWADIQNLVPAILCLLKKLEAKLLKGF